MKVENGIYANKKNSVVKKYIDVQQILYNCRSEREIELLSCGMLVIVSRYELVTYIKKIAQRLFAVSQARDGLLILAKFSIALL